MMREIKIGRVWLGFNVDANRWGVGVDVLCHPGWTILRCRESGREVNGAILIGFLCALFSIEW